MLALGPFFPEPEELEAHKPLRDQMAASEYELAKHLKGMGHSVLGVHHQGVAVNSIQLGQVKENVERFLSGAAANK